MNRRVIVAMLAASTIPLTALPASAVTVVDPPIGSCKDRSTSQRIGSGSYIVDRYGRINYILAGIAGQRDVNMQVWRTSKRPDGRLDIDWQIGAHRPVPTTPKAYRSPSYASRNMGRPVVEVVVHRGWRGSWSCEFAMARG